MYQKVLHAYLYVFIIYIQLDIHDYSKQFHAGNSNSSSKPFSLELRSLSQLKILCYYPPCTNIMVIKSFIYML